MIRFEEEPDTCDHNGFDLSCPVCWLTQTDTDDTDDTDEDGGS